MKENRGMNSVSLKIKEVSSLRRIKGDVCSNSFIKIVRMVNTIR